MQGKSVEEWMAHEPQHEWDVMMKKVAAFHHKHDFEANNGHDMGYRIALTVEELGEFAAAVTKGKPLEDCAEEMADVMLLMMGHAVAMQIDLKAAFEKKYATIMQRSANPMLEGHRVFVSWTCRNVSLTNQVESLIFQRGCKRIGPFNGCVDNGFVNFFGMFHE